MQLLSSRVKYSRQGVILQSSLFIYYFFSSATFSGRGCSAQRSWEQEFHGPKDLAELTIVSSACNVVASAALAAQDNCARITGSKCSLEMRVSCNSS
jgi:hypothetical protein